MVDVWHFKLLMFGGFFRCSYSLSFVGVGVQSGFVLWVLFKGFLVKFEGEILGNEYIQHRFLVCGGDFIPQNNLPCKLNEKHPIY